MSLNHYYLLFLTKFNINIFVRLLTVLARITTRVAPTHHGITNSKDLVKQIAALYTDGDVVPVVFGRGIYIEKPDPDAYNETFFGQVLLCHHGDFEVS